MGETREVPVELLSVLLISAFRYTLARRSYFVADVIDALRELGPGVLSVYQWNGVASDIWAQGKNLERAWRDLGQWIHEEGLCSID